MASGSLLGCSQTYKLPAPQGRHDLGIVLLIAYLTRIIVKHRPRPLEKSINLATWIFGCIVATIYEMQHFLKGTETLFAGITGSVLFYMLVIVVEETCGLQRYDSR